MPKKFLHIMLINVFFSLTSCTNREPPFGHVSVGTLIDTTALTIYTNNRHSDRQKIVLSASPAIVIAHNNEGYTLLLANGQIAWTQNIKDFSPLSIDAKRIPLEGTNRPREFSEQDDFHWLSIPSPYKGKLTGVSTERYESTPYYVKQEGRMLGLPPLLHPFIWPEMLVTFAETELWVKFSDIRLHSRVKKKARGIILAQFIPVIDYDTSITPSSKTLTLSKNLLNLQQGALQLNNTEWKLESVVIAGETSKSDLKSIQFYSSNKSNFLFALQWKNNKIQYTGYSGIQADGHYERIATPVLLDFYLKDTDSDGKEDWQLKIAHVRPDEVRIEELDINGEYNAAAPLVSSVTLDWN